MKQERKKKAWEGARQSRQVEKEICNSKSLAIKEVKVEMIQSRSLPSSSSFNDAEKKVETN